jgi:uncharacterized protein
LLIDQHTFQSSINNMGLQLFWHTRTSDIPESLWRVCFPPPKEGLFWFRALESGNLEGQFTFLYGLLQLDGLSIGIVPAFIFDLPLDLVVPPIAGRLLASIARGPLRRLAYQRTMFIGNVAGEEGQIGLLPGYTLIDVVQFVHAGALVKAVEVNAPMLVWKEFPEAERTALGSLLEANRAFRMVSYPGTTIALMSGGYQVYLASQPAARRWKINDKMRRGAKVLPINTMAFKRPGRSELEEIFALFWQTYLRGKTKFERLSPEFFSAIADSDEATFIVQRDIASGKMLSFVLMLDLGERVINQFIGIDYASGTGGYLYFRLFAAAYDWACTTGARIMQSGQTGYSAKIDMGHSLVPLWNYSEHRNPPVNWVYRRIAAGITWETLDDQLAEYLKAHPEKRPLP